MSGSIPRQPQLSRRTFLRVAGVSGLGALTSAVLQSSPFRVFAQRAPRKARLSYWNDPATWGGRVPGKNDVAIVSRRIILNVNAQVRGVVIKPRGELIFHPRRQVTLRSTGNVVVQGMLRLRPKRPDLIHRLLFPQIDERRFVGGGLKVLASDVGIWVTGKGAIDIAGSPKLAWTKATGAIAPGATSIVLHDDPVGWKVGDEVAITPTVSPSTTNQELAYDLGTVQAIDRSTRRITLRSPTAFEHPAVEVESGVVLTAEILNLTRNVRIEGTPSGRAHIWMNSSSRQYFRNASLRYLGPRRLVDPSPFSTPVLGRYGLHFHMMREASRGSIVKGVVVRDAGNHAFVAHQSHGISFRDCIAHDTLGDAYWWDPPDTHMMQMPGGPPPPTDDVLYDHCVASKVRSEDPSEGLRMGGFFLGARQGNVVRNCVAVGIQGELDSCGFLWPETSEGAWKFEDCLAHNNRFNGITAWQANDLPQVVSRFTAYHNGKVGILHGHYMNGFVFEDSVLYANGLASVLALASSRSFPLQRFIGLRCDQAGLSQYCVLNPQVIAIPAGAVQFAACRFRGYGKAAFGFTDNGSPFPNHFVITGCTFEGNEFWVGPNIHAGSRIQIQDPIHGNVTLRRLDQPGVFRPEWNASVSHIN